MDGRAESVLDGRFRVPSKLDGWMRVRGKDVRGENVLEGHFRV